MSQMTTKQALIELKELIGTKEKWTKNAYARDVGMQETSPTNEDAVCFCTSGGLKRVTHGKGFEVYQDAYVLVRNEMDNCIPSFNDTHSFEEVHAALDRAIEKCPN